MTLGWHQRPFLDVLRDNTGGNVKTLQSEFLDTGLYPIVDQGQKPIAGYTDDANRLCKSDLPVIIFGDHTRCFKFVDFPFCLGADGTKVLRPRNGADPKYLYHYLRQVRLPEAGYSRHFKFLKETEIPLPPLDEQRRIAAILDAADSLRAKRRAALAKLDQLAQSIFIEMFGDPAINPKGWDRKRLIELCQDADDIKCGPFGTQLSKSEYQLAGVPLWGIKQVNSGFALQTHEFISLEKAERLRAYALMPGDIVMTRKGTVGNCSVYPHDFPVGMMHSDLLRLRVDKTLCDAEFLSHQLHHSRDVEHQISLISGGAIMAGVNVTKLKVLEVIVPPIDLQQRFLAAIAQRASLRARSSRSAEIIDRLFASLQHRAFRGEL